jgi:hypothetical protein
MGEFFSRGKFNDKKCSAGLFTGITTAVVGFIGRKLDDEFYVIWTPPKTFVTNKKVPETLVYRKLLRHMFKSNKHDFN